MSSVGAPMEFRTMNMSARAALGTLADAMLTQVEQSLKNQGAVSIFFSTN